MLEAVRRSEELFPEAALFITFEKKCRDDRDWNDGRRENGIST